MHSHKLSEWLCLSAAHAGWPMHLLLDQQTPTTATVHLSTLPMGFAIFAFLQSAATQYANWTCLLDAPPLTNRCHAAQKHVTAAQSFTGCCNSRFCLCGQRRICHPLWCQFTLLTQLPNTAPSTAYMGRDETMCVSLQDGTSRWHKQVVQTDKTS